MKILVVGGGGREHALVWKLVNDSSKPEVFCAPGNAGTAEICTNVDIGAENIEELLQWALENKPDITVVGPEVPLCKGITDIFNENGLAVFGPNKAAAQLEGSKLFAKEIMQVAGVPTAKAECFSSLNAVKAYIKEQGLPIVIKADGLAAGKGVYVCMDKDAVQKAIDDIFISREFGDAGNNVIVEECLVGEEVSMLAMVDGENILMLSSSQDHKRAYNGDKGPNTGGMGAYSPAPIMTDELLPEVKEKVFKRTIEELKKRGIVYKGIMYAGLMLTKDGVKVLEFNCRFGDPETQAVLPRIKNDLLPAIQACIDGNLTEDMLEWHEESSVCVIMASGGYPGKYQKGKTIKGLDLPEVKSNVTVFHAGTTTDDNDNIITSGGRVLGITAMDKDLNAALAKAYKAISYIEFDQAQYRTDIGKKALCELRKA